MGLRPPAAAALVLALAVSAGCSSGHSADNASGVATTGSAAPADDGHSPLTSSEELPEWQALPGLETPRDDFVTAVVGDRIWAMGGMTGARGNRLTSVEVFDTSTDRWRTSDIVMPEGLASFEGVGIGPRIYVFGGLDAESRPTDFSSVLNTRTGRWTKLPPLPHPRYAHTVTEHDGSIYVVGGEGGGGEQVAAVDVFDPRTKSWSTLDEPMPAARNSHDTVSTPDGLMVIGGWLGTESSTRVDVLDVDNGTWSRGPDLPVAMSRAGAAVADGRVWVSHHRASYVLDLDDPSSWQPANTLGLSRHGLGYVHVGDALYAVGGCTERPLRDVRTVEELPLG